MVPGKEELFTAEARHKANENDGRKRCVASKDAQSQKAQQQKCQGGSSSMGTLDDSSHGEKQTHRPHNMEQVPSDGAHVVLRAGER